MNNTRKISIIMLIFVITAPCVQANVFDDIGNINKGIQDVNKKLDSLQIGIDGLNNKTQEVSDSILILEETNQEIQEMSDKFDELSSKISDALEITEKADSYIEDIKLLMTIGISVIILAILTLIGATFVIVKRRK